MRRAETKFAIMMKKFGRLSTVTVYQVLFILCPLTSHIDAQSGATAKDFTFEVVSIRESPPIYGGPGPTPDGFRSVMSIDHMIKFGYGKGWSSPNGDRMRVINLPEWSSQRYQIEARVAEGDFKAWRDQSGNEELARSAMRHILKERFHIVLHETQVQRDGYQLVVRGHGVKFKPTPAGFVLPAGRRLPDGGINKVVSSSGPSRNPNIQFYGTSMSDLAVFLNMFSSRPIYDETKLVGRYDFILRSEEHSDTLEDMLPQSDLNSLGLALKPGKGLGQDFIIDHIEKPTPN